MANGEWSFWSNSGKELVLPLYKIPSECPCRWVIFLFNIPQKNIWEIPPPGKPSLRFRKNSFIFHSMKFLGRDWLPCFISINKFGRFKTLFVTISSLPELGLSLSRSTFLVQTGKSGSMSNRTSENYGHEWDLT